MKTEEAKASAQGYKGPIAVTLTLNADYTIKTLVIGDENFTETVHIGSKVLDKMPWLAETEVGMELVGLSRDQIKRAQAELRKSQGRSALEALRKAAGVVPEG